MIDDPKVALKAYAFRLLSRARTSYELTQKLTQFAIKHHLPSDSIPGLILEFQDKKFLDDAQYAKDWKEERRRYRFKGDQMIKIELRRKGISTEDIENAFMDEEGIELSQEAAGRILIQKKLSKYKNFPHLEAKKKLTDLLLRRGFSMTLSGRLVDEVIQKDYNK